MESHNVTLPASLLHAFLQASASTIGDYRVHREVSAILEASAPNAERTVLSAAELFHLPTGSPETFRVSVDGDANHFSVVQGKRWIFAFLLSGELSVLQQEAIAQVIADALNEVPTTCALIAAAREVIANFPGWTKTAEINALEALEKAVAAAAPFEAVQPVGSRLDVTI